MKRALTGCGSMGSGGGIAIWFVAVLVAAAASACDGGGAVGEVDASIPCAPCSGNTAICDPQTGVCVGCLLDADCAAGSACCGHVCLDVTSSAAHCGGCATSCTSAPSANTDCRAGRCVVTACSDGYADCNHLAADGCESRLATDVGNCGGCDRPCGSTPHTSVSCSGGACMLGGCLPGFADCNMVGLDGCEIEIRSDLANCGACGVKCGAAAHGTAACQSGLCVATACAGFWTDCNLMAADGCEVDVSTDPRNCSACGHLCPIPDNATVACRARVCAIGSCNAGYGDCDANVVNGCEVRFASDVLHCGDCRTACPKVQNGVPACVAGACRVAMCAAGFGDCNQQIGDGCETPTDADPNNCGGCGVVCPAPRNGSGGCKGGACVVLRCDAGFEDCDGLIQNGCETAIATDPDNCGVCGKACGKVDHGARGCQSGICTVASCEAGWGDCDLAVIDGCEKALVADDQNCGACFNVCAPLPNASVACAMSACGLKACNPLWADCDQKPANGCELDVSADVKNCGGCNKLCVFANGAGSCTGGACVVSMCNANYKDCNGVGADGCEAHLPDDVHNCGACKNDCGAKTVCVAGACKKQRSVLLVHGETNAALVTDLQTALTNTGAFTSVGIFNAVVATPSVVLMQTYDAVLVWSDSNFLDAHVLGDNLATYFDGGGQVVTAVFADGGTNAALIGGKFGTVGNGYILITPAFSTSSQASLGAVAEPQSALMANVATLTATSAFRGTGALANGGVAVASWTDGAPLIIRGTVNGRARVDLNLWPVSSASYMASWSGDGVSILRNALLY